MPRHRDAATAAGRAPPEIRRIYNVGGRITEGRKDGLLKGPPEHLIETLISFAGELGLDNFVCWPDEEPLDQLERFAAEVIPVLRG